MTISGERTEQLNIFCRVTGFTSDFLSYIDVELIRFFHGALQYCFVLPGLTGILAKYRRLHQPAAENVYDRITSACPPPDVLSRPTDNQTHQTPVLLRVCTKE